MKRYIALIGALTAVFAYFAIGHAYTPTRPVGSRLIVVDHSRWLARCDSMPVEAVDGIEIESVRTGNGRIVAVVRKGKYLGYLTASRLGVYQGSPVYSVVGPTVLRDRMDADPACPQVVPWPQLGELGADARDWIAERSTCCGEAVVSGRTYRSWPCRWSTDRPGEITITRLDGYGPGVVGSRRPCAAYSAPE